MWWGIESLAVTRAPSLGHASLVAEGLGVRTHSKRLEIQARAGINGRSSPVWILDRNARGGYVEVLNEVRVGN